MAAVREGSSCDVSPSSGQTPRLMTAQEVADMLRVPRSTVFELARSRRIPFIKVGRRARFTRETMLERIATETVWSSPGSVDTRG